MISVIIPHYKNKEKFFANLKHNLLFLKNCEVIVVNDFPQIPLKKEIESIFPSVVVIDNKKNLGFAGAVSVGIQHAKNPYIFLLNDDVVLLDDAFINALEYFKKRSNLFAVSFKQLEKNNDVVGRNTIYWKRGLFLHDKSNSNSSGINGWAEGGSMILEKEKYIKINGFDTLYSPFYWEDIDLSYRAWKAGYEVYFDTNIVVEHHHESTIATHFSKRQIHIISYRNQLITIWKNISDSVYINEHVLYLIKNCILSPFKNESELLMGFLKAIFMLPLILEKRRNQKKMWLKSDRNIFNKFKT